MPRYEVKKITKITFTGELKSSMLAIVKTLLKDIKMLDIQVKENEPHALYVATNTLINDEGKESGLPPFIYG